MKAKSIDKMADKLRLEYCAQLGVPAFRGWSDILLESVREYWRKEAKKRLNRSSAVRRGAGQ